VGKDRRSEDEKVRRSEGEKVGKDRRSEDEKVRRSEGEKMGRAEGGKR
jgi:hypothetical protein